ncbi:hypothetical protein [Gilvimarinus algae]|uniref:Uncharacterized protein n=1 Tax=Gilvimarinus algae TaxID=3058037 RepID=A0ABT8THR7_9GAMM|nr:hypothetical protein [Gilvimarinus sp. SDUM040014]MDO3383565.1 hypothetical protein [Gilvimarinus sp. SDUM040014]
MLLSTSSFKAGSPRRWLTIATVAACTCAAIIIFIEFKWRSLGYHPQLLDSPQLWSIQRSKARAPNALVFAGASRTQFGIDLDTVEDMVPSYQPVMLAINGRYPIATLRSLASDKHFNATVILDIDSRGLQNNNHSAQESYNSYFSNSWTPSWHLHRLLLSVWQKHATIARPEMGAAATTIRLIDNAPKPFKFNSEIADDRSGLIHFTDTNTKNLARHFAQALALDLEKHPPPTPEKWINDIADVPQWVKAIEARGGKVVIYEPPVSGRQLSLADNSYPRRSYWDLLSARYSLTTVSFRDIQGMQSFQLPDESHIAPQDKSEYTRLLITYLLESGLIEAEPIHK